MPVSRDPQITIPGCGAVQGLQVKTQPSVAKFLNVPYATVPERWRPAFKAAAWSNVRDCTVLGPACPQPAQADPMAAMNRDDNNAGATQEVITYSEEHCLNLNIFAPLDHLSKANALIPVMVWIHGGGFVHGSNALPLYDGSNFVAHSIRIGRPVILVTINYRLNYLGFMSSAELKHDATLPQNLARSRGSVGNWGLMDQKMALEWVRDHIDVFGGSSQDVTAFGESAGAVSISYHLLIPENHGLFQKVILQSGAATTMAAGRAEIEGQRYFDHLCRHFGLQSAADQPLTGAEKLELLRAIDATELVKAGDFGRVGMFTPTIDDILIHQDPRIQLHDPRAYDQGIEAVMLGDCRDEGRTFVPFLGAKSMKRWDKFFARNCPPDEVSRREFEQIYGIPKTDKEARQISSRVISDSVFLYPTHATSLALMKKESPALDLVRFHFDRPLKLMEDMGIFIGAHHAIEIPFVFGSDAALALFKDPAEKELSRRMMEIWILFAWGETNRQYGLTRCHRDNSSTGVGFMSGLLPSDIGVKGRGEALVFSEQATVERGLCERLDDRTLAFWRKHERWVSEKRERQYSGKVKKGGPKM
ncbi:hypothetical protein EMPS_10946 [Entomortierella parvispora]|uniref:Carboxylesterase type B domain-containing protein n=1 Tax=Entomortierella parvispora TaxID=205924 RepID=A0A9P3HLU6_9FUNG|nr:hypothetical protein EMPS_10946 [Entomortierella parvispora]